MSYFMIIAVKLVQLASTLLSLYMWVVIISAVLSWVNPDPYNAIVRFLRNVTDPVYERIRRLLPFIVVGGMDLSPIVVIVAIQIINALLERLIFDMSMSVRTLGALTGCAVG